MNILRNLTTKNKIFLSHFLVLSFFTAFSALFIYSNIFRANPALLRNYSGIIFSAFIISLALSRALAKIISTPVKNSGLADSRLQEESQALKIQDNAQNHKNPENFLSELTNGLEEGLMLLDTNFKIIWANKKIITSSGVKPEEVLGSFCYKITHKREDTCQPPNDLCPVLETLKTKKPTTVTHIHYDKDGNAFYVEVCAYILYDQDGKIKQFVHISRDITSRVQIENKLKESLQAMSVKIKEMEGFQRLSINRELKMVELKEKIEALEQKIKERL